MTAPIDGKQFLFAIDVISGFPFIEFGFRNMIICFLAIDVWNMRA